MKPLDKQEIKRLLTLHEKAESKVRFNHNGTRVENPMQQAAANRLYTRAYRLAQSLGLDILPIHREVINEIKNKK